MHERHIELAHGAEGTRHPTHAGACAIDGVRVEGFAQYRESRPQTTGGDPGLMDGPNVACLGQRHRLDKGFEPLSEKDEEGRAMVHTIG
jgi:hypothetical protein